MIKLYKSDKIRFITGLIFIIIIYSWFVLFMENTNVFPVKIRHLITFITTIAVYLVGTFHLGKMKYKWLPSLWHLVNISGLCIIIVLGLFNWFIMEVGISIKLLGRGIQELIMSPVLYVAIYLLNRSLNKNKAS
jgi:phosphoglycerol transferase MdoB-like AlkP superfamily enzyme